jgi:hypothetical protein
MDEAAQANIFIGRMVNGSVAREFFAEFRVINLGFGAPGSISLAERARYAAKN